MSIVRNLYNYVNAKIDDVQWLLFSVFSGAIGVLGEVIAAWIMHGDHQETLEV
jgi:hypothetical protein